MSAKESMYSDGGAMTTSETWCQRREKYGQDSTITSFRVDIGFVENLDDVLFLLPGCRVHLEISSDKELARHSSAIEKFWSGGGGVDWKMIRLGDECGPAIIEECKSRSRGLGSVFTRV